MGLMSTVGRCLFALGFLLTAWREYKAFGSDGGPTAEVLRTKFGLLTGFFISKFGVQVPKAAIKYVIAADIALKGIGGILFVLNSSYGGYVLLVYFSTIAPLLHSFEKAAGSLELLLNILKDVALLGALLLFLDLKKLIIKKNSKKRPPKSKTN